MGLNEYLSGRRAVGGNKGKPAGAPGPAAHAVGVVVAEAVVAQGKAVGAPPLAEMVDLIKRELGLGGNMKEVIASACKQLGVDATGKNLHEQGHECWTVLY